MEAHPYLMEDEGGDEVTENLRKGVHVRFLKRLANKLGGGGSLKSGDA